MNETMDMNLREAGKALLKHVWLIALCALVMGVAVLLYTVNFVTPVYDAKVTLYVNNNSNENSSAVNSSDLAVAQRLVDTYITIIKCDAVQNQVIERLALNIKADQLRGMISAESINGTEVFAVKVTTPDPQMSADIANVLAEVAPGTISEIIDGSHAKVIDYATVPTHRSSPNYLTSAMLGVVIGAVLAAAGVLAYMYFDVHVKTEETLSKICNAPILGVIPDFSEAGKVPTKKVRR